MKITSLQRFNHRHLLRDTKSLEEQNVKGRTGSLAEENRNEETEQSAAEKSSLALMKLLAIGSEGQLSKIDEDEFQIEGARAASTNNTKLINHSRDSLSSHPSTASAPSAEIVDTSLHANGESLLIALSVLRTTKVNV